MLEVKKFGANNYGVWVIGTLYLDNIEITNIFNTNLKDVNYFDGLNSVRPNKIKISTDKNGKLRFTLEFLK